MKKLISLILSACLTVSLSACAKPQSAGQTENIVSNSGVASTVAMGRWVESEVELPNKVAFHAAPSNMADGSLRLYATDPYTTDENIENQKLYKLTSADGVTWQSETQTLPETTGGVINEVAISPNGSLLFQSVAIDGENYTYSMWLQKAGGEAVQLDLAAHFDNFKYTAQYGFIDDSTFYIITNPVQLADGNFQMPQMAFFSVETLEKLADYKAPNDYFDGHLAAASSDAKNSRILYLAYTDGGYSLTAINADGTTADIYPQMPETSGVGGGYTDADGNYYFTAKGGIYRLADGGTLIENIVGDNSFMYALNENYPMFMSMAANGDFFVVYMNDAQDISLYRYHFDETLPAQNENTISVWSLNDSATVRAAIAQYSKQNADTSVNYTVALDGKDAAATEDALRTLNTQLLGGDGPDVIIFDGFDYTPYINKGMLADLSGAVDKSALVQSVAVPYTKDGAFYVMPAKFSVPLLYGDDGTVESLTTLDALQSALLAAAPRPDINGSDEGYYGEITEADRYGLSFLSVKQLLDFTLQASMPAILDENGLNEENLRSAFSFIKAVSDYSSIADYRADPGENGTMSSGSGADVVEMLDGGYEYSVTNHAKYGRDLMYTTAYLHSMYRREGDTKIDVDAVIQPGLCEGAYLPTTIFGVSAASKLPEAALGFAKMLVSAEVQDVFSQDGMPVLQSSLDNMVARNKTDGSMYKGDEAQLLAQLKTPVTIDNTVEIKLLDRATALCKGTQTIDEAVNGVKGDLSIYLSERQ